MNEGGAKEFEPYDERVWLNTAHQGRLPGRAVAELEAAVRWKVTPHLLEEEDAFKQVPHRLRTCLARLLNAEPEDIVLANSASYGLHLIANGLDLAAGDEVVVAQNDFPSDVLPWLRLRGDGVDVRLVEPAGEVLTPEEVEAALTPRTRVLCLTWVHSFSGQILDVMTIGELCRSNGTWFVLNGSQGVGSIPISVGELPVDALISVGFKWLCGPYGTGLCWLRPELFDQLVPKKLYWLNAISEDELSAERLDLEAISPSRVGRHDIFGTANFFNFVPFAAAVELILERGVQPIFEYDQALVARLLEGLPDSFDVISGREPGTRSSLVVVEPLEASTEEVLARLEDRGIVCGHRRGRIRISPHLYNTEDDIDRALEILRAV